MTHRNIKIVITTVVLVGAFAGLLWSSLREGTEYYKHVDEVAANAKSWEGKRLQLHGYAFDVRQRPGGPRLLPGHGLVRGGRQL